MKITDSLSDLGLNPQELQAYDLILRRGALKAKEIALALGLGRQNTYNIIKSLQAINLVTEDNSFKVKRFIATHPKALIDLIDIKEQNLSNAKSKLQRDFSSLISQYILAQGLPGISQYQGIEGLKKVYADFIYEAKDICSIQDMHFLDRFLSDFNRQFIKDRIRKRISHRLICPESSRDFGDAPYRSMRYISDEKFKWNLDLKMNDKKVAIISTSHDLINAVVIQSPIITKSFQALFEVMWSIADS